MIHHRKKQLLCKICMVFWISPLFVSAAAKQSVAARKELHLVLPPNMCHLDPAMNNDMYSLSLVGNVYEGLMEYHYLDRPLRPVPNLAAAMPMVSPDFCTYTFILQKGIFFHDNPCFPNGKGREVVAEDVVYSFKRLASQSLKLVHFMRLVHLLEGFETFQQHLSRFPNDYSPQLPGVKAIDRYTVQFTLTQPCALFLHYLAMPFASVVPKEAVECYGEHFKYHPVGTGPFVLPSLDLNARQLVFSKNNRFRAKFFPNTSSDNLKHFLVSAGKKLPLVDKLVYHRPEHERPTEHLFFKNVVGVLERDYLSVKDHTEFYKMLTRSDDLEWLKNNGITPLQHLTHGFSFIAFNGLKKPLHLQKVRKAISLAFDRIVFNNHFMNNLGIIPHSYIPFNLPGYNPQMFNPYIAYNLEKAKQLLAEAGYPDGKGFPKLTLDVAHGERLQAMATFFADCMKRIGISVEVQQHSFPDLLRRTQNGEHALVFLGWRADFPACSSMFEVIRYPGMGGGIWVKDASFDTLYDQAMQTVDDEERAKLFQQLDAKAAELVPCLLLPVSNNYVFVHQWVKNYVMNPFLYGKAQYINVLPHTCKSIEVGTKANGPSIAS